MSEKKQEHVADISLVLTDGKFDVFVTTKSGWTPEMIAYILDASNETAKSWRANNNFEE